MRQTMSGYISPNPSLGSPQPIMSPNAMQPNPMQQQQHQQRAQQVKYIYVENCSHTKIVISDTECLSIFRILKRKENNY